MLKRFKLDEALRSLDAVQLAKVSGRLVRMSGMLLESIGCQRVTGQRCYIEQADGSLLDAQVVGFNRDITYLMPFKKPLGLSSSSLSLPNSSIGSPSPLMTRPNHDSSICKAASSRAGNTRELELKPKGFLKGIK